MDDCGQGWTKVDDWIACQCSDDVIGRSWTTLDKYGQHSGMSGILKLTRVYLTLPAFYPCAHLHSSLFCFAIVHKPHHCRRSSSPTSATPASSGLPL